MSDLYGYRWLNRRQVLLTSQNLPSPEVMRLDGPAGADQVHVIEIIRTQAGTSTNLMVPQLDIQVLGDGGPPVTYVHDPWHDVAAVGAWYDAVYLFMPAGVPIIVAPRQYLQITWSNLTNPGGAGAMVQYSLCSTVMTRRGE